MSFEQLVEDSIEENQVYRSNSNQFAKIERLGSQLKL